MKLLEIVVLTHLCSAESELCCSTFRHFWEIHWCRKDWMHWPSYWCIRSTLMTYWTSFRRWLINLWAIKTEKG